MTEKHSAELKLNIKIGQKQMEVLRTVHMIEYEGSFEDFIWKMIIDGVHAELCGSLSRTPAYDKFTKILEGNY
jgi:hypothetical protein